MCGAGRRRFVWRYGLQLLAAGIFLIAAAGLRARAATTAIGSITDVTLTENPFDSGAPFVLIRAGAVARSPGAGTTLEPGDMIVTSLAAFVSVSLQDGSRLLVGPGSRLTLVSVAITGKHVAASVKFEHGLVRAEVSKVTPPFDKVFELSTANAIVGVHGTQLVLESPMHEPGQPDSTTLSTLNGRVLLTSRAFPAEPVAVSDGEMSSVAGPNKPTPPAKFARQALADRLEAAFPTLGRKFIGKDDADLGTGPAPAAAHGVVDTTPYSRHMTRDGDTNVGGTAGGGTAAGVDFGVGRKAGAGSSGAGGKGPAAASGQP